MDSSVFARVETVLQTMGAKAAIEKLCAELRDQKDYHNLFYALLMKKRHELGVSPIPTGPAQDLPEEVHSAYEEGIRQAGREVGELYLQQGDISRAWNFFRMLGEPERLRAALEAHQVGEDEDISELVQIAFYEGVHPTRGFDWILDHFGICSAITTLGGQELPFPEEVRQHCLHRVVRALYAELSERLAADIERVEGKVPEQVQGPLDRPGLVRELMKGRDWLFAEEDCYHIDVSHLSSVVQMSVHLQPGLELGLARELCEYGQRLPARFHNQSDPPFEDFYRAHGFYLSVLDGYEVEQGLDFFRAEAERADPEEVGTLPAEVLVNLLLRLGREQEALSVASRYLQNEQSRPLLCPGITELCRNAGDYQTLAAISRERGDPVHFLAGLLASQPTNTSS
jgi:hypothetical protein